MSLSVGLLRFLTKLLAFSSTVQVSWNGVFLAKDTQSPYQSGSKTVVEELTFDNNSESSLLVPLVRSDEMGRLPSSRHQMSTILAEDSNILMPEAVTLIVAHVLVVQIADLRRVGGVLGP